MPSTLGIIFGNRDFFPDHLVSEARDDIFRLCQQSGLKPIALTTEQSKLGCVETHSEARQCADLFTQHRDEIDGILVVLPNFGDEKGVVDTLKMANLKVPVLVQAYPDDLDKLQPADRRDAFCGKISVCNNLVQAGIPPNPTRAPVTSWIASRQWSSVARHYPAGEVRSGERLLVA